MILSPQDKIDEYTGRGWWGTDTLTDLFRRHVAEMPDALALADPPNRAELAPGDPLRLSWSDLSIATDRLAAAMLEAGVGKDDVVMVQLPNVAELIIVYLAAGRIGAILSPLPVQFRTHELRQTMTLVEPKLFITTADFGGHNYVGMVQGLWSEIPSLQALFALGDGLPEGVRSLGAILSNPHDAARLDAYIAETRLDANDVFTICWTSGTEAEPKGVPRSHNLWTAIAWYTVDGAQFEHGHRLLNPFPMVNMSAIGGMLFPWLLVGGTLFMHHPLNLPVFLQQITTEKIHYTVAPPVLLDLLLMRPQLLESADLSAIKNIGSGSAPLSPSMTTAWKEKHGIDILNFFGSNEGVALVSGPGDIPDAAERARFFPRFGHPDFHWGVRGSEGMIARLVDPVSGETITGADQIGELCVMGPTVFHGYYRQPEMTARAFDAEGYFHTGDLFAIDGEGGNRYRFVGRLKDLIIRGGNKISPEELELLLAAHPKVAEVAVVGYLDGHVLREEHIAAAVVARPEQEITLSELHEFLREKDIADYKMPKKLVALPALPRNPVGKVLKREIRRQLGDHEA